MLTDRPQDQDEARWRAQFETWKRDGMPGIVPPVRRWDDDQLYAMFKDIMQNVLGAYRPGGPGPGARRRGG